MLHSPFFPPLTDVVVVELLLSSVVENSLVDDIMDGIVDGLDCSVGEKASVADGSRPAAAAAQYIILGIVILCCDFGWEICKDENL